MGFAWSCSFSPIKNEMQNQHRLFYKFLQKLRENITFTFMYLNPKVLYSKIHKTLSSDMERINKLQ